MLAVVVALAAAETRFFLPAGPLPGTAPVYTAPAEISGRPVVVVPVVSEARTGGASTPSGNVLFAGLAGLVAGATAVLAMQGMSARTQPRSDVRMDETIIQKALAGELEEEGAENVFMSETGWADWLDKNAQSSYAMNERPSKASDGYYTPDVFSNPIDIAKSWVKSMQGVIQDPLSAGFMTISNDMSGARSYPKGKTEVDARTIKPKVKNFDAKQRVTGIPGFNMFGAPGFKSDLPGGFGKGKQ